jgi:Ser/Thr protein kinase RdoA (MazF antagonist)
VDGIPEQPTTRGQPLVRELGLTLGRLHRALAGVTPPAIQPRFAFGADPVAALRAAYDAHDRPECPHTLVRQALTVKLRRARALDGAMLDDFARLRQQVIHGDVHPGNIIFQRAPACGAVLIDFDLARYAPPAYELVRALIYCVQPAGPPSAFTPRIAAFLDGYLDACPLSARELGTMAALFETVQILDAHGLDTCHEAPDWLLQFGQARFALLYWLREYGPLLTTLALRTAQAARHGAAGCP